MHPSLNRHSLAHAQIQRRQAKRVVGAPTGTTKCVAMYGRGAAPAWLTGEERRSRQEEESGPRKSVRRQEEANVVTQTALARVRHVGARHRPHWRGPQLWRGGAWTPGTQRGGVAGAAATAPPWPPQLYKALGTDSVAPA